MPDSSVNFLIAHDLGGNMRCCCLGSMLVKFWNLLQRTSVEMSSRHLTGSLTRGFCTAVSTHNLSRRSHTRSTDIFIKGTWIIYPGIAVFLYVPCNTVWGSLPGSCEKYIKQIVNGCRATERFCASDAVESVACCWAKAKVQSKSAKRKAISGQRGLNEEQVGPLDLFLRLY